MSKNEYDARVRESRTDYVVVNTKNQIKNTVMENLLEMHKHLSKTDNVRAMIILSKFILKLANNMLDKICKLRSEDDTAYPPDNESTTQPS